MVRFYILFLMAFCNVLIPLNASEIKGTVLDEYDTPMQYAKVVLYQDSNFICGTVTDSKGLFTFTDFQKANRIDISMTGYQTYSSIPQNNMGIITLSPDFKVLGEVTVLSQKPTIKLSNEGMVTTVTGSILANVGTADDVICRLPLVNGKNGAYTVFGAGTPTVYINGRQVRDVSELQQLSSNNINSVEVITNPGFKYPSNIRAVIKIKTKKPIGDGIGIGLWSRNGISHYPSTSNILNAKYRKGGIDLFGTVYYSWGKGRNRQHFEQTTFTDAIYTQDMYGLNTYTTQRISGKVGVNWQLNDKHSFGFFWQTNQTDNHSYNNMISDIRMDNVPFEHWESSGSSEATTRPSNSANLYYNGSIGKLLIDFNADYMDNKVTSDRSEYETSISDGNRNVISHNRTDARLFAEKTILTYPIWKGDLEVGQEYTNTSTHFKYYYTGATIPSSDNSIHESNITIFSELRQTFGIFQIGTGIRYEHVDNKYTSYDSEQDIKTFKYDDIFPSIFLSTQIHDVQLGLNFTAKKQRPSYSELDGTIQYVNRMTYQQGNPLLKSTKLYTTQIQGLWKFLFLQASFTHKKDAIFNTTLPVSDNPNVRLLTVTNVPNYSKANIVIGVQPRFGIWSPDLTLGIEKQWYKGIYLGEEKSFGTPTAYMQFNNWITLPHEWMIGVNIFAKSGGSQENGFLKPTNSVDISIFKTFLHKTLSIWLQVSDIFDNSHNRGTMYVGDYRIRMNPHTDTRNISLTLQYNFNTSQDKYKGKGAGDAEKQRL